MVVLVTHLKDAAVASEASTDQERSVRERQRELEP